jgi:hypothetical protein
VVVKVIIQCPFGHKAEAVGVDRSRGDYDRHYEYVQCSECKRVFVHRVTIISISSIVTDSVIAQMPLDEGWTSESGDWVGAAIEVGYEDVD